MQLSKRLQRVADCVTLGNAVADIGCDHAYISIYLIKEMIASSVIALDINKQPLQRAKENIKIYGLQYKIETRLSNGAKQLVPGEVNTLLISGLGGSLTVHILAESKEVVLACEELVLQPQSELFLVRSYLRQIKFDIIEEDMIVEEDKYYVIIKAKNANHSNSSQMKESEEIEPEQEELYDLYGFYLLKQKNKVLQEFLNKEKEKSKIIIAELMEKETETTEKRKKQLQHKIDQIEKGLQFYEM